MTQQRRLQAIEHRVIDSRAHSIWTQTAQGMLHDQAVEFGQAALLGFELQQVGEGRCADRDGRDSQLFEQD